jgi:cysteine desulfuration protein SufE
MYLEATLQSSKLFLNADSEALISKGLAALLIKAYSGETPDTIAHCPPVFIKEIGLQNALSPARSNGLASLYHKIRQEALKYIL